MFMENSVSVIFIAIVMGTLARVLMIRVDYRQYPSYPQSFVSHLILGFVAACLGAVVTPAFLSEDYAAVTFLALATGQFKDIRSMERDSLERLESMELVRRGEAYIEDIAKRFEARNYVAFLTSFSVCTLSSILDYVFNLQVLILLILEVVFGLLLIFFLRNILKPNTIADIADVKEGKIHFKGPLLMVDDVVIMNIGYQVSKDIILEKGMGITIYPKGENAIATLANIGQRQAIIHNLASQLGIRKDVDEPDFTPLARREPSTGNISLFILTMNNIPHDGIVITKNVPVLESARRKPDGSEKKEG